MFLVSLHNHVSITVRVKLSHAGSILISGIKRNLAPVWDSALTDNLGTVVDGLDHVWIAGIGIFSRTQDSLQRKTGHRQRHAETEFNAKMLLVNPCHGKIGERVLRIIIETHHVALVLYLGIECRETDIVALVAVLVIEVCRICELVPEVADDGVAGTR